jgi:hypothetical protein
MPAAETPIAPMQFAKNVLYDQKPVFSFPATVVHGKHWKPVIAVTLVTAGLVAFDPYTEPYFHNRSRFASYKTGPCAAAPATPACSPPKA